MNNNESLAHTKWDCTYHIVWMPKYRSKVPAVSLSNVMLEELGWRFFCKRYVEVKC